MYHVRRRRLRIGTAADVHAVVVPCQVDFCGTASVNDSWSCHAVTWPCTVLSTHQLWVDVQGATNSRVAAN